MIFDLRFQIADFERPGGPSRRLKSEIRNRQWRLLRVAAAFLIPAFILSTGCNYHPVRWRPATGLRVPIFENQSDRRMNEFDLTDVVIRRLHAHTPYQINRADADLQLDGTIEAIETPGRVEGRRDQVLVSDLQVGLRIVLKDLRTNRVVFDRRTLQRANFSRGRSETEQTVRAEVNERLAQWVVDQLQAPW